jgi:hypothetical protein
MKYFKYLNGKNTIMTITSQFQSDPGLELKNQTGIISVERQGGLPNNG